MKKLMWLLLFWLPANGAQGQRAIHSPVFRPPSQHAVNIGLPPVQPIPPLGVQMPFPPGSFSQGRRSGAHRQFGVFPSALPLFYDYGGAYPAAPNVIIVQPPPPAVVAVPETPAREPVRSEMREYKTAAPGPSQGEQPAFAIVLKDGSVRSAMAVWAQNDVVHYIDMDGAHRQVSADAIDRDATRATNRQRGLDLRLPPSG